MDDYKVTIHSTGEVITGTDKSDLPAWLINKIDLAVDACDARGIESGVTVEIDGSSEDFTAQNVQERRQEIARARAGADTPEAQAMYENEDTYGEEVAEMDAKSKALNS